MIFFAKVKVITEPFSKVVMFALCNPLMNGNRIKLNRNVLRDINKNAKVMFLIDNIQI